MVRLQLQALPCVDVAEDSFTVGVLHDAAFPDESLASRIGGLSAESGSGRGVFSVLLPACRWGWGGPGEGQALREEPATGDCRSGALV